MVYVGVYRDLNEFLFCTNHHSSIEKQRLISYLFYEYLFYEEFLC